ncbi:MFS transporter [Streptomyces sp. NPDC058307]|uniref:MFS transporter n=1 Tax=Streptomyces sp. NPDC058307 TaxID=3346439 RepID=UPI0036EF3320
MADVDISRKAREQQGGDAPSPLALPVILAGTFMVVLDFFIVNVAIPAVQHELDAGTDQVQLIVAGYGLAYACGLITAGRLGDVFGRRRLYVLGLLLFTVASLVCGIAPTASVLVLARVVQGVGAAVLSPQVLTILGVAYAGPARARAFTAYGMVLASASVGGQLIGGALIQADVAGLGWRSCFLINVPIGVAALLLTSRVVPESRAPQSGRLDIPGALVVTLGLVAVVLPLVEGREKGWPVWTWVCLALALPLLGVFAWYQHRLRARGGSPLIDLVLFRQRAFTVGLVAVLVLYSGVASFFLVLALYLQQGRGLNALDSGLTFAVMGVGFFVTSLSARKLGTWLGRQALAIGGVVLAVGQLWLLLTVSHTGVGGSIWSLMPALLLDGAGLGMVMAPLNAIVLAGIAPQLAGAAAGVLTTMMQVGNAMGVALIGIIYYGRADGTPKSTAAGLDAGLVYLIALAVVLAVAIQLLPGKRSEQAA